MTQVQAMLIEQATREYEEDGLVSTTTFIALNNEGLDAESIITAIEETCNGE